MSLVATTVTRFGGFHIEYYILTSRPKESLRRGGFSVRARGLPEELGVIDVDFAIGEGSASKLK